MEKIMNTHRNKIIYLLILAASIATLFGSAGAQTAPEVLSDKDAATVIPSSFYFAGQSAPTQMRNASAGKLDKDRFVIAGLVDTSGYSTEISGKYEGFFITDSPVKIGDKQLGTGAYGFGFSKDGKLNIFDLSAKQILSVATQADADMKRPRPLQLTSASGGLRLYKGKNYVTITSR
jgi:hypothetical protein